MNYSEKILVLLEKIRAKYEFPEGAKALSEKQVEKPFGTKKNKKQIQI